MNPTSRNTRTWTDAQLRAAVAEQVTWQHVAHVLGLNSGNGTRLKRYAERLGLDTSHFLETRRWSELDLRSAVADTSSWPEVMRRLKIDDTSEARLRVKGHAVRLGLDVSQLKTRPVSGQPTTELLGVPRDLSNLRRAAESIAVAWFTVRGIPVAVPTDACEYDLLVTLADGIQRVQVKSSAFRGRHGTWTIQVGRRPYVLDKTAAKVPYDPDDLDYFFIIDGDGALYFIPIQVVAGRTVINIGGYAEYRIGDASSLFTTAA